LERQQLMEILLDLVEVSLDDDPRRDARRSVPKDELLDGHAERVGLLEDLIGARLLTTYVEKQRGASIEMVDIIHETLLGSWPKLREEIAARRQSLRERERFRLALGEWQSHGRSADYLLEGIRLAEARDLAARNDVALRDLAGRQFLTVSNEHEQAERTRELRQARRRQAILGVVAGAAVLFAAVALAAANSANNAQEDARHQQAAAEDSRAQAEQQRQFADEQRQLAEQSSAEAQRRQQQASIAQAAAERQASRQIAAQAMLALRHRPDLTLLLGLEARNISDTLESRNALLAGLSSHLIGFLPDTELAESLVFSPDGQTLVEGTNNGVVEIWDVASRGRRAELKSGATPPPSITSSPVSALAFSSDGRFLAEGQWGGTVTLWDLTTGTMLGPPIVVETEKPGRDAAGTVWSIAFSPDSRTLASGTLDGSLQLWDVATQRAKGSALVGHKGGIASLQFNTDGSRLLSSSLDAAIVWDVGSGTVVGDPLVNPTDQGRVVGRASKPGIAFSEDGRLLAAAQTNGTVRVWEVEDWRPLASPLATQQGLSSLTDVVSLGFSSDGSLLAAGGEDGTVHVWGLSSEQLHTLDPALSGHGNPVHVVAFAPRSNTLASAGQDWTVRLWDLSHATQLESPLVAPGIATFQGLFGIAFSPDSHHFAASYCGEQSTGGDVAYCERGLVATWDLATNQRVGVQLQGPVPDGNLRSEPMSSVAYSPDGRLLAAGDFGGVVYLWNLANRQFLGSLDPEPEVRGLLALAFSPDGALIAASEPNGHIALWDVPSRLRLASLVGPEVGVSGLAFSPDGQLLAVGGADGAIHIWDARNREPSGQPLQGPTGLGREPGDGALNGIAFSHDGQLLAGAGGDGVPYVWAVSTRQPVDPPFHFPLGYTREALQAVAFSPDGRLLATYDRHAHLLLWDVASRQPWTDMLLHPPEQQALFPGQSSAPNSPQSIAFSPDGNLLAVGTEVWDVSLTSWEAKACYIAGRNMTRVEWNSYMGEDTAYHRTCPDLPDAAQNQ
jgi:WD40 repeat protein